MLGTSSAVSETLKNLVLPGIGHFTIVDDVEVTHADFGHEFFVTRQDIGRPKCEVISEMMTEMNPDVRGTFRFQSIDSFVHEEEAMIKSAQLVIAVDLTVSLAERLCNIVHTVNVPFILIRQYGMLGYMRIFKAESTIIEKKEAAVKIRDLRVSEPWPELEHFAMSFDLESL